jgi:hypothetical protein
MSKLTKDNKTFSSRGKRKLFKDTITLISGGTPNTLPRKPLPSPRGGGGKRKLTKDTTTLTSGGMRNLTKDTITLTSEVGGS